MGELGSFGPHGSVKVGQWEEEVEDWEAGLGEAFSVVILREADRGRRERASQPTARSPGG